MGKFYYVGSIITDTTKIKYVQSKLDDGILVYVRSPLEAVNIANYIKAKSGKDIYPELERLLSENKTPKTEQKPKKAEPKKAEPKKAEPKKAEPKKASTKESRAKKARPVIKSGNE
jgi:hypothetical protein